MDQHFYTFGGKLHKQTDGGTIGTDIAGEVARNVMSVWDTVFLKRLKEVGIHMDLYKRYMDDQLDVCAPINPGWMYNIETKKMEYNALLAKDDREEPAIRTASFTIHCQFHRELHTGDL